VLENLLDNSAGFAPPASEVEVTVTREGPWAVLRVADPRAEHPGLGLAHCQGGRRGLRRHGERGQPRGRRGRVRGAPPGGVARP
jgi:hypothetical protein